MNIEKARALPIGTQRHGRIKISANPSVWKPIGTDKSKKCKYKFAERDDLTKIAEKYNIDSLPVISLKNFHKQVDLLYAGTIDNDKKIKNVIRLPNINKLLAVQLGVSLIKCYFTKTQMTHCRPSRKAKYNQALRIEEFKRIPIIIHNTNVLYYDGIANNFFIPFRDRMNPNKINKIIFYKDKGFGNFAVTVEKVDLDNLSTGDYIKFGVGSNPQIHKSRRKVGVAPTIQKQAKLAPPNTRLLASSVFYNNIAYLDEKSIYKAILEKLKNIEILLSIIDKSLQRKEALY